MLYFAVTILLIACIAAPVGAAELYVSRDGDDANPGTIDAPFASLAQARDAVLNLKTSEDAVTVFVRGGAYFLETPLILSQDDSGAADSPVIYRSYPGEDVTLVGGKSVTGWEVHEGAILKADLAAQGLAGASFKLLMYNGRRMEMARWPNRDPEDINGGAWAYVDGERFNMYRDWPGEEEYHQANTHLDFWQRNVPKYRRMLTVRPEDERAWSDVEGAELSIFPRFNWWHYMLPIESFDAENGILQLAEDSFYEIRPGDRYFVRGIFEELDMPGEWYLDQKTDTLYFWPPEPCDNMEVFAPTMDNIIVMENCKHVAIEGFTIECCEKSAVSMQDAQHCTVASCTIRNVGGYDGHAVDVVKGARNRVIGNDIYDIGAYGVNLNQGVNLNLGDFASLTTLEPTAHVVDNNYIHHVGRVGRHAKGIEMQGFGNIVTHNLIHDIPQSAIYVWSANNTIEYNHIRHTCLEGEDTGAIGGGAINWLGWQNTKLRYNLITDTFGFGYNTGSKQWESPHFTWALYPDWAASDIQIVGNIIVRAPLGLLHLHSGRNNLVENNILIDGERSQLRLYGWTTETGFWSTRVDEWIENYEEAMKHKVWRELGTLDDPREVPVENNLVMRGNVFRHNICSYRAPNATLFDFENLPLKYHEFDHNVYYHQGDTVRTGQSMLKKTLGDNLLTNSGLEDGTPGIFPVAWGNVGKTAPDASATVVSDESHGGKRALRVFPGMRSEKDKTSNMVYMTIGSIPFKPGKAYQLSVWLKSAKPGLRLRIGAFSHKTNVHHWSADDNITLESEWKQYTFLFVTPAEEDVAYSPTMETLSCRVTVSVGAGLFWVDDVSLREVETCDEWTAWRKQGMDVHSIVADPLFVDPENEDYRLREDSPALKLGFKPIPLDKIGPYKDDSRASWPIAEASGAREALAGVPHVKKDRE